MHLLPVAVVPRFLSSVVLALLVSSYSVFAPAQIAAEPRYLADIELHTEVELLDALHRSDQLLQEGTLSIGTASPVKFVLHGPEVRILLRENYSSHRETVDLAAKLSAFGVIDLKVCETWMGGNRVSAAQLPPFVGTVPYGPAERRRLIKEQGYVHF
jgi:intracellular sulfur oxidation DsrE/DsrF family protein